MGIPGTPRGRAARSGSAAAFLAILALVGASRALAREPSREERRWVEACLDALDAESPRVAAGAEAALVAFGPDALALVIDETAAWTDAPRRDARDRVLFAWGRDEVGGRIRRLREGARGVTAKRLDEIEAALLGATPPARGTSPTGAPDPEETRWARDVVAHLVANSPRERDGAERALVTFGADMLAILAQEARTLDSRAGESAATRLFEGVGTARAAERLRAARERLSGSTARVVDAWLERLEGASAPGVATGVALAPAEDLDWERVPAEAEREIPPIDPSTWPASPRAARVVEGDLVVDAEGDGAFETRLHPGETAVVHVGPRGTRPVLLYAKRGRWYACSASLLRGTAVKREILFWDVDLDGRFDGSADRLAWAGGAFRPVGAGRRLPDARDALSFALERAAEGWRITTTPEPAPRGAPADPLQGLAALNAFRNGIGLAPLAFDGEKARGAALHAAYLARNASPRSDAGEGAAHTEDAGRPGYTEAGLRAASSSCVGQGDAASVVRQIERTMLHRTHWLAAEEGGAGLGVARRNGSWCVVWTGSGDASARGAPVCVPAPGQRNVPLRASGEAPHPDDAPDVYEAPRGYPISVTLWPLGLHDAKVRLFFGDGETALPGHAYAPEHPIAATHADNDGTAFFLPDQPLEPKQQYWAEWTATDEGGRTRRFTWTFHTD